MPSDMAVVGSNFALLRVPIRPPLQGDFADFIPRAEALGYSVIALQAKDNV
jgi:hypothetical protein